jgi:hypothetical protein
MTIDSRKKRPRATYDDSDTADHERRPRPTSGDSTRKIPFAESSPVSTLPYLKIHRVACTRTAQYHKQHMPSADFFDVLCPLAQSNRKTALQGRTQIKDIKDFLEENDDLSFAVCLTYSCKKYHKTIKDDLKLILMPAMEDALATSVKPFLFVLHENARRATTTLETLFISDGLREALRMVDNLAPKPRWD